MKFSLLPLSAFSHLGWLILTFGTAQAATVITQIDAFSDPEQMLEILGATGDVSDTASGAGVLGGSRVSTLVVTSNQFGFDASLEVGSTVGDIAIMDLGSGVTGRASFAYSMSAAADFTAGGADGLLVSVEFSDQPFTLELVARNAGGAESIASQIAPATLGTSEILIAYDTFAGAAVDFSEISSLEIRVIPGIPGTDVALGIVGTTIIPEPHVAGLVALGAVLLCYRRRCRG